jgi:hypothetical protein
VADRIYYVCVMFARGGIFCVMCFICVLCHIVVALPPGKPHLQLNMF